MKKKYFFTIIISLSISFSFSQDCLFYANINYSGDLTNMAIGDQIIIQLDSTQSPSWMLSSNAAIKIERVTPPDYYPSMLIYSERDAKNIGGTSDYMGQKILVRCLGQNNLPQPLAYVPIDAFDTPIKSFDPGSMTNVDPGDTVLVVRKAYIYENAEDLGCCHGPWGSVGLSVHPSDLLPDFNNDFNLISEVYCGGQDFIDIIFNNCSWYNWECGNFLENYPVIGGVKLPGPIYTADNPCDDISGGGLGCLFIPEDPSSEWIDGPWGTCYSNLFVLNWTQSSLNEVTLLLREGDDTNCDDFMGAMLISKDQVNTPILFKAWMFGWVILENVIIPEGNGNKEEKFVGGADFYWNYSWDGSPFDPSGPAASSTGQIGDPYFPFFSQPGDIIQDFEVSTGIISGAKIGLMGKNFPVGTFSKPMIYCSPCGEPATFGN